MSRKQSTLVRSSAARARCKKILYFARSSIAWLALSIPFLLAYSSTAFSCSGVKHTGIVLLSFMTKYPGCKIITLSALSDILSTLKGLRFLPDHRVPVHCHHGGGSGLCRLQLQFPIQRQYARPSVELLLLTVIFFTHSVAVFQAIG